MTEVIGTPAQDQSIPTGIKIHYSTSEEDVIEPAPEPIEEPSEETTEEDSEESKEETDKGEEGKPYKKSGYKKTKEQRDQYRSENEALKAELEALKKPKETPKVEAKTEEGEPNPDDYQTMLEYTKAVARYEAKQEANARDEARNKQAQEEQTRKAEENRYQSYQEKVITFKEETPDFEKVLKGYLEEGNPLTPAMEYFVTDAGPEVAYYIAKNPEIGQRMATMSDRDLLREIGKIEARLEIEGQSSGKRETKASAPISPVKNNANTSQKDYSKMDLKELRKHWKPVR